MNPDKYTNDSELIELRLQLHHEKCRADNLWEVVKFERAERKRLEAEVERLESDLKLEKENEDRLVRLWQTANNEVHGQRSQIAALIDNQTSLKADVERLRKAGIAMGMCLPDTDEANAAYRAFEYAAKEGKQS